MNTSTQPLKALRSRFPLAFLSLIALVLVSLNLPSSIALGAQNIQSSHGLALFGELKYPADFSHLEHINPNAPKGGHITLMATGTFDTLNPYTLKGISPVNSPGTYLYGINEHNESLMMGTSSINHSADESMSAYGLIAKTLTYPEDFSWISFELRSEAKFHDGKAISSDDVAFSFDTLREQGHPSYRSKYQDVLGYEIIDAQNIRFNLQGRHKKRLILSLGELPVLPKHFWQDKDFKKSLLSPPLGSGPYKVSRFKLGRSVRFERVADYWGKDLGLNRGRYNFDVVDIDFYRDLGVAFEAFKAGRYDVHLEYISKNWATGYDFKALHEGRVHKLEIPHQIPAGSQGFFFNTRRELFKDVRVRKALSLMMDFEWMNEALFYGAYTRSLSYFANTPLAQSGVPSEAVSALLEPLELPSEASTQAFALPINSGKGSQRKQIRAALRLLKEAGWTLQEGQLRSAQGEAFSFEILERQASMQRVLIPLKKSFERIGVQMSIRLVDAAQYKTRLDNFDFDMTTLVLGQSLAPGEEQYLYFHSSQSDIVGSQNYAGVKNPAIDSLITSLMAAQSPVELQQRTEALDRALLWNYYMIPNWHIAHFRLAHWDKLQGPQAPSPYYLGFENWWVKPGLGN